MQSKGITNFRPVSFLNVEGKNIFLTSFSPYEKLSDEQSLYKYICPEGCDTRLHRMFETL